ncbi:MAG: exodeoxyribonuclease V subunit gamma [Oscillospiraceae bacterium]|nr:exodeoxyribonuclease V subunit gamma [Oscillospiraceae bacterium]
MIYFYTGGAGGGKSTALINKIKMLSDDDNNKICVIVPEQYSYEFEKILYKSVGASKFNNIDRFSFKTLSRDIIRTYGDTRSLKEYANENKKTIIVNMALDSVYSGMPENTGFYKKQYKKTGFAESMSEFITEIKQSGVSAEMFEKTKEKFSGRLHEKMKDISAVYREYERLMSEYGFRDSLNDITESAHIAGEKRYFSGKTVFIDEFDDFTGDQYQMLEKIISDAENVYIGLRTNNVNAPEFTLFDTVNRTYRNIVNMCGRHEISVYDSGKRFGKNDDLRFLNRNIFRNSSGTFNLKSGNTDIFEARDFYSEAEYICANIKHIIYENPDISYNDIAVISNDIESYAPIIENACRRYEIPYFTSMEKDVSHTVIMTFICSLLDIVSSDTFNTEAILKYLKTGLAGIELTEISRLENFCYKWSIKGKKWLDTFIPDDKSSDTEEFLECEKIRQKVIIPLENLKSSLKNVTAEIICKNIYQFITDSGADHKIMEIIDFYNNRNETYFAGEQKKIWDFLIDILNDLSSVLYGKEISVKSFSMLFRQLLSQARYSLPPRTLDSITIASALTARLSSPKIVFITGVNEGIFPMLPAQDRLFSNDEREKLSAEGFNKNKSTVNFISNARLASYKALSSASEKLYISYSLTSLDGQGIYRSQVIENIEKMFPLNSNPVRHESEIKEDFYAVTPKSAYYHLMQNKKNSSSEIKAIKTVLEENPDYKPKIDYVYKINPQGINYTLSDRSVLDRLVDFHNFYLSNTKFETYSKCHFRYFCQYCLNLKQRKKIEMNVMDWGTLRHNCFCKLLSEKNPEFIDMSEEQIRKIIADECTAYKEQTFKSNFKEDSRAEFIFSKIIEQILIVAMHFQLELKNTDFVPSALEANLMDDKTLSPLNIKGNNGNIIFTGTIDRIDTYQAEDGKKYIRIIDYKSSRKTIEKLFIDNGINMQMLLYMLAVIQNGKFKNYIPAGMLYAMLTISYPTAKSRAEAKPLNISSGLKFRGIARNDSDIIEAMDKSGKKTYVNTDKKSPPVLPFSGKQIDELLRFSENKLIQMNNSLYNGDISIDPLINKKINACEYCEFSDICGDIFKSHDGSNISDEIDRIFDDTDKTNEKE